MLTQKNSLNCQSAKKIHIQGNVTIKQTSKSRAHKKSAKDKSKPMKDIMKEITSLKNQLNRVKSKKKLQIDKSVQLPKHNSRREAAIDEITTKRNKTQEKQFNRSPQQNRTLQKNRESHPIHELSGNLEHIEIKESPKNDKKVRQKHRVQLNQFYGIKNHEYRLKLAMQLNKLKSILSYQDAPPNQITLLCTQLNLIITNLNNLFQNYEHRLKNQSTQKQQIKSQLYTLTEKSLKMEESYLKQRSKTSEKKDEILELKRSLSYYLELERTSRSEIQKYIRESEEVHQYVKELEKNNSNLRNQVGQLNRQINSLKEDFVRKAKEIEYRSAGRMELEEERRLLEVQLQRYVHLNNSTNKQLNTIIKQNEQNSTKITTLQQQLQQKTNSLITSSNTNKQLTEQICQLTNKEAEALSKIRELQSDIQIFNTTCQQLEQYGEQIKQENNQLKNMVKDLESNLRFCQQQNQNYVLQVNQLKVSNQRYKNKLFKEKINKQGHVQYIHKARGLKNKRQVSKKDALQEIHELIKYHQQDHSSDDLQ